MKIAAIIIGLLVVSGCVYFKILGGKSAAMDPKLGLVSGQLTPCPDKPNCTSTYLPEGDERKFESISSEGQSIAKIEKVLSKFGLSTITKNAQYIHATATSGIFGFVDDVEFYIDTDSKKVHARSASRIGHSDMGANKGRLQKIMFQIVQN